MQFIASRIARRTALLSSSSKAHPSNSTVSVGWAVAAVVQRRRCCWSNCLMRFCAQFDVPARLIQAQHLLAGPLLAWQGSHQEYPACQVQCVSLHPLLVQASFAPLAPLGCLPLLLAQAQGYPAQGDALALIADPDRPTTDAARLRHAVHTRHFTTGIPLPSSSSRGRLCGVKRTTTSAALLSTKPIRARRPLARSVIIRSPARPRQRPPTVRPPVGPSPSVG
jgi:hypothetical protein